MEEKFKILWMDDDIGKEQLLPHVIALEKNGFEVTGALTREMAEIILEGKQFDLVITDLLLPSPGSNPVTFLELAKSKCPDATLCVISGYLDNSDYQRALGSLSLNPRLIAKPLPDANSEAFLNLFIGMVPHAKDIETAKIMHRKKMKSIGGRVLDASEIKIRIPWIGVFDLKKFLGIE